MAEAGHKSGGCCCLRQGASHAGTASRPHTWLRSHNRMLKSICSSPTSGTPSSCGHDGVVWQWRLAAARQGCMAAARQVHGGSTARGAWQWHVPSSAGNVRVFDSRPCLPIPPPHLGHVLVHAAQLLCCDHAVLVLIHEGVAVAHQVCQRLLPRLCGRGLHAQDRCRQRGGRQRALPARRLLAALHDDASPAAQLHPPRPTVQPACARLHAGQLHLCVQAI